MATATRHLCDAFLLMATAWLCACDRSGGAPAPPSSASEAPTASARASASTAPAKASASAPAAAKSAAPPAPSSPVIKLVMGHARSCALREDSHVVCWGACDICGDNVPPAEPTAVAGLDDATALAGDDIRFCALKKDGSIACWEHDLVAKPIAGVSNATALSNDCAVLGDGRVSCWAEGTVVAGVTGAKSLARGNGGRCALLADGTINCWGGSMYPYLDSGTGQSPTPVAIVGIRGADQIETSLFRGACARAGGKISCWGGEIEDRRAVHTIRGIKDAVELALTEYHGCARTAAGTVACWGSNDSGQLGSKTGNDVTAGVVSGVRDAIAVAVGGGEPCGGCGSSCAVNKRGEVHCWGAIAESETPKQVDLTLKSN